MTLFLLNINAKKTAITGPAQKYRLLGLTSMTLSLRTLFGLACSVGDNSMNLLYHYAVENAETCDSNDDVDDHVEERPDHLLRRPHLLVTE